jgi:hypothetical protein
MYSPSFVASTIALASDEPESAKDIEDNMVSTVQLIALQKIWKLSAPDPKKAAELLSGVTVLLQRLSEARQNLQLPPRPENTLRTTSEPELSS